MRWIAALLCVLCLAAVGVVGQAAFIEESLRTRVSASLKAETPEIAAGMREAALRAARAPPFAPLAWHGGAIEAAAWARAVEPTAQDPQSLAQTARLTARAVGASPVHPAGWARLAGLAAAGAPAACAPTRCLQNSWLAAPMGLPLSPVACERIQLAVALGLVREADDLRVRLLLRSGLPPRAAAACLRGLPPETIYQALIAAR